MLSSIVVAVFVISYIFTIDFSQQNQSVFWWVWVTAIIAALIIGFGKIFLKIYLTFLILFSWLCLFVSLLLTEPLFDLFDKATFGFEPNLYFLFVIILLIVAMIVHSIRFVYYKNELTSSIIEITLWTAVFMGAVNVYIRIYDRFYFLLERNWFFVSGTMLLYICMLILQSKKIFKIV